MTKPAIAEVPIFHSTQMTLSELQTGSVDLGAPVENDIIQIQRHVEGLNKLRVDVKIDRSLGNIAIARQDGAPMQVFNAAPAIMQDVFKVPIDTLELRRDETGFWQPTDPGIEDNLRYRFGVADFVEVVAGIALQKQIYGSSKGRLTSQGPLIGA